MKIKSFMKLAVLAIVILIGSISYSIPASADIGIRAGTHLDDDGGQSVMLFGDLRVLNQSLGWYVMRTYEGTDTENILVGVDYGFRPLSGLPLTLSIGPAYAQDPLRATGQNLNFHLAAEVALFRHFTLSLEHWSNCRRICRHNVDTSYNPPRNMLMAGFKF